MKLLPLLTSLVVSSLFAQDLGKDVYEKKCALCHVEDISKAKALKNLGKLKAPPMIEISNQIKNKIMVKGDDKDMHRGVVIAFIKHYVEYPDMMIGMCNAGAYERFDEMPSQKGNLTASELNAVAEWLYDNFEGREFR